MKSAKQIKSKVNEIFNRIGNNVQFNIMDLGKISKAAEVVLIAGGTDEAAENAMSLAINQYRLN